MNLTNTIALDTLGIELEYCVFGKTFKSRKLQKGHKVNLKWHIPIPQLAPVANDNLGPGDVVTVLQEDIIERTIYRDLLPFYHERARTTQLEREGINNADVSRRMRPILGLVKKRVVYRP